MSKSLDDARKQRRDYMRQFEEECRMEAEVDVSVLLGKVGRLRSLTRAERFFVTKAVERKAIAEAAARQQWNQHTWDMRHQGDEPLEFAECNDEDCMCHRGATSYYHACKLKEELEGV